MKKKYSKPSLENHGKLEQVTQANTGGAKIGGDAAPGSSSS